MALFLSTVFQCTKNVIFRQKIKMSLSVAELNSTADLTATGAIVFIVDVSINLDGVADVNDDAETFLSAVAFRTVCVSTVDAATAVTV